MKKETTLAIAENYIYNQIYVGNYPMGSAISESDIANDLNMSRTPVREAIRVLQEKGILKHYVNRGTIVSDITDDDIYELFELRMAFEDIGLKNACTIMDPDIAQSLKRRMEAVNEETSIEEYSKLNDEFHNALVVCSGNKRLIKFYNDLAMQIHLVEEISARRPEHFINSNKSHLKIINAILNNDYATAHEILEKHLTISRDRAMELVLI